MKTKHLKRHKKGITPNQIRQHALGLKKKANVAALSLLHGLALRQKAVEVDVEKYVKDVPGANVNQLREVLIKAHNLGIENAPYNGPRA